MHFSNGKSGRRWKISTLAVLMQLDDQDKHAASLFADGDVSVYIT